MPGMKWQMGGEQAHAGMRNEDEDVEGHALSAKNAEDDTSGHIRNEDDESEGGPGPDNLRIRVRNTEDDTEGHASRALRNDDEDTEGHVSRVK